MYIKKYNYLSCKISNSDSNWKMRKKTQPLAEPGLTLEQASAELILQ